MSEGEKRMMAAEAEAVKSGTMTLEKVRRSRQAGRKLTERCGLTPKRVWELTRHMRAKP